MYNPLVPIGLQTETRFGGVDALCPGTKAREKRGGGDRRSLGVRWGRETRGKNKGTDKRRGWKPEKKLGGGIKYCPRNWGGGKSHIERGSDAEDAMNEVRKSLKKKGTGSRHQRAEETSRGKPCHRERTQRRWGGSVRSNRRRLRAKTATEVGL